MNSEVFISLVNNVALLLSLGVLYYIFYPDTNTRSFQKEITVGVLLGGISIAVMLTPWKLAPGIIFDSRSVLLSVTGLYFGFVPTLIASILAVCYRLLQGGTGALPGIGVILTSSFIGLVWAKKVKTGRNSLNIPKLLAMGFTVHLSMLLWMFVLPMQTTVLILKKITVPVLLLFPIGTVLLAKLIERHRQGFQTSREKDEAIELAEQSIRIKDAIIANLSHEIRTPLNAISGYAVVIEELCQNSEDSELQECFGIMNNSCDRLIEKVETVIDYSRILAGDYSIERSCLPVSELMHNITAKYREPAESKNLDFIYEDTTDGNYCAKIDKDSFEKAISKLLDNAIKFTHSGTVRVELNVNDNSLVELIIDDTGIGMSEAYSKYLYEPYFQEEAGYTRSFEGLGLGLAIAKNLLALNRFNIVVSSKQEIGTRIMIQSMEETSLCDTPSSTPSQTEDSVGNLPAYTSPMQPPADPGNEKKKEILIVEDDISNQYVISKILETRYGCHIASSPEAAMRILNKYAIDLILMDLSLEGEINGLELTKTIKQKKRLKHIPVIAVTAHEEENYRKKSFEAGCIDYLIKPVDYDRLKQVIASIFNNPDQSSPS